MQLTLIIKEAQRADVRRHRLEGMALTIGRGPENMLVLAHGLVSTHHLRFVFDGIRWRVEDLGSTNGTWFNDMPLHAGQLEQLSPGCVLRVGSETGNITTIEVVDEQEQSTSPAAGATVYDPSAATPGAEEREGGAMHLRSRTVLTSSLPLVTIGRDPASTIHLEDPKVSSRHAHLDGSSGQWVLRDLNSMNGTFVNGERLSSPRALKAGDIVKIANYVLEFDGNTLSAFVADGGMRVDIVQLRRDVGPRSAPHRILHDVSMTVQSREFVALLGPSGAGKSTLLKATCGAEPGTGGQVLVNGDSLSRTFDLYRSQIGYVPQDDIIHLELPVASALRAAARLRLPADTSAEDIEARVQAVLDIVELRGKEETVIGSLSGGQRKRVSIAVELLAEPRLLFLDEPTSGLDPGLDRKMMQTLRSLADQGRTVVLVTHATANLNECDLICLMAQGRVVYFGPLSEAFSFFGVASESFAEVYSIIDGANPEEAVQRAEYWQERYRQSPYYQRYVLERNRQLHTGAFSSVSAKSQQRHRRAGSALRQFFILIRRYLELVTRDRLLLATLLVVMPLIALLVGAISESWWLSGQDPCLQACVDHPPPAVSELLDLLEEPATESERAAMCLDHYEMERRLALSAFTPDVVSTQEAEALRAGDRACPNAMTLEEAGFVAEDGAQRGGIETYGAVKNIQTTLFIIALAAVLLGLFSASYEIVKERSIYARERMVNLSIPAYLASKFLVLSSFALVQGVLLLGVLQLSGLDIPGGEGVFLPALVEIYVTVVLATIASIATGLFVSSLTPTRNAVIYIILLILFFQILASGGVFELSGFMEPVSRLNVTRWAIEGLGGSIGIQEAIDLGRVALDQGPAGVAVQRAPSAVSLEYVQKENELVVVWLVLAGFAFAMLLATLVQLKSRDVSPSAPKAG